MVCPRAEYCTGVVLPKEACASCRLKQAVQLVVPALHDLLRACSGKIAGGAGSTIEAEAQSLSRLLQGMLGTQAQLTGFVTTLTCGVPAVADLLEE